MPIKPNFLERFAFYRLNAGPAPMLDLGGALAYQVVSTAVQLNIFNLLAESSATPAELTQRLNSHLRGTQRLLEALRAIGYVDVNNGRYHNTSMTQKWFLDSDSLDIVSGTKCWDLFLRELWPQAGDVVMSGKRPYDFYEFVTQDPAISDAFQQMMVGNANISGPEIIKKIGLPQQAGRLLDVGGGHGVFTVLFCEAYPDLHATVIDSEMALKTAERHVSTHKLDQRIELYAGDFWQMDWGTNHDLILLFNVLHHFDIPANEKLLAKANAALIPGGKVAILEQVEGDVFGSASEALVRLIGFMYYLFADGRIFSDAELTGMLTNAGFDGIKNQKLSKVPGHSLVTAVRG